LNGGAGNDSLSGKKGADTLVGGEGDDTYLFTDDIDTVVEAANQGRDTIISRQSFALANNVEDGVLIGAALTLSGNALANVLTGTSGANTLDGGGGADILIGGKGNDTYIIDNAADTVVENTGEGSDAVQSSVNYALSDNIENLTLTGTAEAGMGNDLANKLWGNDGSNKLWGGAGNDTLDGGAGADILFGGLGNDTYYVDSANDIVVEAAGEGTDKIVSSVSYVLSDNLENLTLGGTANINAIGNSGNNILEGNAGNNILFGGQGNDTYLFGRGAGQDIIINQDAGKPSNDKLQLGDGIAVSDLSVVRKGNDLALRINGSTDQMTVLGYFDKAGKSDHALEQIRFADGTSWAYAAVNAKAIVESGPSAAQALPDAVKAGDIAQLFTPINPIASQPVGQMLEGLASPQSIAQSIAASKERFETGLNNLRWNTDSQGQHLRSQAVQQSSLPLLWSVQDALLRMQLAKGADGRFSADVSLDTRGSADLTTTMNFLGAVPGAQGRLDAVARMDNVQQFELAVL
jgi:Ca2+-binding RTX toxin-like protein